MNDCRKYVQELGMWNGSEEYEREFLYIFTKRICEMTRGNQHKQFN